MEVLVLESFSFSIRHLWDSGCRGLHPKMSLFGKGLFLPSMGRGLSCGRPLGVGTLFVEEPFNGNHCRSVKFWNDICCSDLTLKRIFSRIIFHILDKGSLGGESLRLPRRGRDLESLFLKESK